MMISLYDLAVVCVLHVVMIFCMAAAFASNRRLKTENDALNFELVRQKNLTNEYQVERDIALARAKSHRSFWELRKDERIEELEAENRALREAMREV